MIREVSYGLMVACFVSGALAGDPQAVRAPVPPEPSVAVGTPVSDPIAAGMDVEGDSVAVIGENRKLLIFPVGEVPEMSRGRGVILQRYKDGGLADAVTLTFADGLSWAMGGESGRTRTEKDLLPWKVARGAAGRLPPTGFPKDNRF